MNRPAELFALLHNITVSENVPEGSLFFIAHPTRIDEQVRLMHGKTLEQIAEAYASERRVAVIKNLGRP